MSKILTDKEILDIISKTVKGEPCEFELDQDSYRNFVTRLADVIADTFGGTFGWCENDGCDDLGYTVSFDIDNCVPDDGGVYKFYDTDVTWKNGKEVEHAEKD